MTNFFLDELRKIYGDGRVIHDPQFVGECCYGSLGDLRVKARFTKDIIANQYPYLTVSILNPAKGEIDSVRMKIGDVVSRSCRSTNPNLRNTEPHIWVDGKTPQWYACCPGSRDYARSRKSWEVVRMAEQGYDLMHKDDVVAFLQLDDLSGAILKVTPGANPELLPLGGSQGADSLRKWWLRRAVPISQGNIAALLQREGIPSTQRLLVRNLGLSLSDHYWIKPSGSELTWTDVSPFSNTFCNLSETAAAHSYSPDATLQGDLIKKWLVVDDTRCLLKGNRGANSQQSLNEVLASMLHEKQGFSNHVRYRPVKFTGSAGEQYGCICEDFASETLEFIPAIDVVDSEKKDNAVATYEHFIHVCTAHGLSELEVRSFLEYQILTDFVLTNTDRHLNNFGILRDSQTLKFVRMAPIFDSGNSMFWDSPRLPECSDCTEITVNSFRKTEAELLKLVTDRSRVHMDLLPGRNEIAELYAKDDSIAFVDSILTGYEKKKALLERFMEKGIPAQTGHKRNIEPER